MIAIIIVQYRIISFIKRILMNSMFSSPAIVTGLCLLISEICKTDRVKKHALHCVVTNKTNVQEMLGSLSTDKAQTPVPKDPSASTGGSEEANSLSVFDGFDYNKRAPQYAIK